MFYSIKLIYGINYKMIFKNIFIYKNKMTFSSPNYYLENHTFVKSIVHQTKKLFLMENSN